MQLSVKVMEKPTCSVALLCTIQWFQLLVVCGQWFRSNVQMSLVSIFCVNYLSDYYYYYYPSPSSSSSPSPPPSSPPSTSPPSPSSPSPSPFSASSSTSSSSSPPPSLTLQFLVHFGLFQNCPPLYSILWITSPFPHAHVI